MKLSILSLAFVVTLVFLGRLALAAEPAGTASKPSDDRRSRWILVYKVDAEKTHWRPDKIDSLVAAVSRRVHAHWWNSISVQGLPPDKVEICMPPVSGRTEKERQAKAERIRKLICATGALEFRIVATNRDNEALIETAKAERKKFPADYNKVVYIKDPKTGKELAKWCRVRDQEADKLCTDDAALVVGKIKIKDEDGKKVEKDDVEVLVLIPDDAFNVTGADIRDAQASLDAQTASPEVSFSFNRVGGAKFGRLTGEHVPIGDFKYKLAIVLDNVVQTAPVLQSAISDSARITGHFTQPEVQAIVDILNSGSLPAALEPTPVRDAIIEDAASK